MTNDLERSYAEAIHPFEQKPTAGDLIVIGIGASVAGVQALKDFVASIPEHSGMAYIIAIQGRTEKEARLARSLAGFSKLPVSDITGRTRVTADHIYVTPEGRHLMAVDGHLNVIDNTNLEDKRAPIDMFFRTLADAFGPRAVAVILSGRGAHGSMGLKRIKEMGGAAFVQNPREAEFNEMPRNAIATELVDQVLGVAEMPHRIVQYKQSFTTIKIPVEELNVSAEALHQSLHEVLMQLRLQTGHDFTNYKRPTLIRRIERRISVRGVAGLDAYAALLRENPAETQALLKDLLISVTNFFRDRKAFEALETSVIPLMIKEKMGGHPLRIWVAGCASGEEAYSIAMLCLEQTSNIIDAPKVQIFATDIDETAIAQAREGLYNINDAADVSPERLARFFLKEGDMYRVRREIRDTVLFATHNIIKDPPFSRVDIVSCRNLLIYLNKTAQDRVLDTFHFALNPGGFLFLGSAESAEAPNDLFATFNRKSSIFQKKHMPPVRPYPVPESIPVFRFDARDKLDLEPNVQRSKKVIFGELHQRLLEQYAPPSLIVDERYEIVHLSERAGKYLQMTGGEPSKNLLDLILPELRLELRSMLYQAVQRNAPVETRDLRVSMNKTTETINVHVRPVLNPGDIARGYMLILFEQVSEAGHTDDAIVISSDEPVARHLEEELVRVKNQLHVSNMQHEFHAEELKASNEELQAMNEELRAAAEELETSKEELQSINEELRTVNLELKLKVDETTLASNNLQNLINSADIATIFLDRRLRVAFFTPAARSLFNLIPSDHGRPLSDITSKLDYDQLIFDAESVLEDLQPQQREVQSVDGKFFIMRVLPYRTSEDRINGVVVTFVDVSIQKENEAKFSTSQEHLRLLIESAKDYAIFGSDCERKISSWNPGAEAMMGYSESEIIGQSGDIIFVPEDREKGDPEREAATAMAEGVAANERWHLKKDGSRFYGSGTVRPLYDAKGIVGFVKIMRDLTESKKAQEALRESEERFRAIVSQTAAGIFCADPHGKFTFVNTKLCELLGFSEKELLSHSLWSITLPDDRAQNRSVFDKMKEKGEPFTLEKRVRQKSGGSLWVSESVSFIGNGDGQAWSAVGVVIDITDRKHIDEQKDEFISIASHELKTPVTSIKAYTEIVYQKLLRSNQSESALLMEKLNNQVDRLVNLIRDLLDTSRIAEGKLQLHLQTVDLNSLIVERLEELQRVAVNHPLIFKAGEISEVRLDRERIGQILTNLIANALKYSPPGSEVQIFTESVEKGVKVSVTDRGVGIPREVAARIFERFFRAASPQTESLPGMGLGLYISAGIIKRHGGSIGVDSTPGEGSTFYFTLPIDPGQEG